MPRGGARSNTGGKREGAGRKPFGTVAMRKVTVTLPAEDVERLRTLGKGNISAGIRALLGYPASGLLVRVANRVKAAMEL